MTKRDLNGTIWKEKGQKEREGKDYKRKECDGNIQKLVESARMMEEWERKEKEMTRKGWKDMEYGGMICQKSPDWLEPRGGNSI